MQIIPACNDRHEEPMVIKIQKHLLHENIKKKVFLRPDNIHRVQNKLRKVHGQMAKYFAKY